MRTFLFTKNIFITLLIITLSVLSCKAQNLTAAQMGIYFGTPKTAITTNSQGTATIDFDRNGRITQVVQGNMKMVYEWTSDGKSVTISMYNGSIMQDSGYIEVYELSNSRYKYCIGGMTDVEIIFKKNGAYDYVITTNGQMSMKSTYHYKNEYDMYPNAVEMSMGDQSIKSSFTVKEYDTKGNAIVFTQEAMWQVDETSTVIEYY